MNNKYDQNFSNVKVNKNYDIKSRYVIVIDEVGKNLGRMETNFAVELAENKKLDLVEVNGNSNPPIAKMCDYSKFIYEQKKRAKDKAKAARANAQDSHIIQIHLGIEQNDLNHKFKQIKRFIDDNDIVKFVIVLRGRETSNKSLAFDFMNSCLETLSEFCEYERPKAIGKNIETILKLKKKQ